MSDREESTETALCTSCGLCCDGTLFRAAIVRPDEQARMRALGLDLSFRPDGRAFAQPCSLLVDRRCRIYPERPEVCRSFACLLLKDLRDGTVTEEQAAAIVATALSLNARAADARQAIARSSDELRPDAHDRARAALETVALNRYLDRHFRTRREDAHQVNDRLDRG